MKIIRATHKKHLSVIQIPMEGYRSTRTLETISDFTENYFYNCCSLSHRVDSLAVKTSSGMRKKLKQPPQSKSYEQWIELHWKNKMETIQTCIFLRTLLERSTSTTVSQALNKAETQRTLNIQIIHHFTSSYIITCPRTCLRRILILRAFICLSIISFSQHHAGMFSNFAGDPG